MPSRLRRAIVLQGACAALIVLPLPSIAYAQHDGGRAPRAAAQAPREASQFAFLIGQWELTVMPKVSTLAARIHGAPKLQGTWKAWRALDGFGIEDELRIADRSGNPNSLTHAVRLFDATQGKWTQVTVDAYRGRMTMASAQWNGQEMTVQSSGTDAEGKPVTNRARFYDISPNAFKYQNDRSSDGGRTWETAIVRIDARRVAATAPR